MIKYKKRTLPVLGGTILILTLQRRKVNAETVWCDISDHDGRCPLNQSPSCEQDAIDMDSEKYQANLSNIIAGGFVTSALVIGRELGLFDAFRKLTKPASCKELADRCDLKERYVREWLGCMVASSIVALDDADNFFIPDNCKPLLANIEVVALYPVVNELLKKTMECFRKDGPSGYRYEDMPKELPDAMDARLGDGEGVLQALLPPVLDIKGSAVTNILDVGSGAGVLTRALCKRFPDSAVYGIDSCGDSIDKAKANTESNINVTFVKASVDSLPSDWTNKFDWVIIFDVLHDLPRPEESMREVLRVMKDDGVISISDPNVHSNVRDNVGDFMISGIALSISSVICLPSSMSSEGAGNGIGWGLENRLNFITKAGLSVKDTHTFGFSCNLTCVKSN
ncbi:S-adenosylmethionine-dependent methyltransferase Rv2258c-like [Ylistrum balloti]|uniref:S-adenosylmethionine-dependent methyltransferase Rv2258c-like n=1 Tax=Ylistrum balloti TaxID=509963 RepID=UPI002905B780|nr:S-adenosylmethionine-dependent methyltransferase Rv2258c-like [Ylistrum balloti]